jgi:hypothetical protein
MEAINQAHIKILPYEKDIIHWLSISEKNAHLYLQNPIQAIESANIGIPRDVLNELTNISQLILNTSKK